MWITVHAELVCHLFYAGDPMKIRYGLNPFDGSIHYMRHSLILPKIRDV